MTVRFSKKNICASQSSTGEQKALLTAIILAHSRMIKARYNTPPILLFDEVTAHFDERRRDALFDILDNLGGQVWLSGQDIDNFRKIQIKTIITIKNNQFQPLL